MPAKDIYHNAVKNALIKDGWKISDDPYIIEYRKTKLYADLGAERPIAVERNQEKLVVEVKSFVGTLKLQDLKEALGQYDIYRYLLDEAKGHYIWMNLGWQNGERITGMTVYVRLREGKFWIEEDWTEEGIATDLVRAGVPKEDIVLAFHEPKMRQYTDFAVA